MDTLMIWTFGDVVIIILAALFLVVLLCMMLFDFVRHIFGSASKYSRAYAKRNPTGKRLIVCLLFGTLICVSFYFGTKFPTAIRSAICGTSQK